jgi:hypothetical protein
MLLGLYFSEVVFWLVFGFYSCLFWVHSWPTFWPLFDPILTLFRAWFASVLTSFWAVLTRFWPRFGLFCLDFGLDLGCFDPILTLFWLFFGSDRRLLPDPLALFWAISDLICLDFDSFLAWFASILTRFWAGWPIFWLPDSFWGWFCRSKSWSPEKQTKLAAVATNLVCFPGLSSSFFARKSTEIREAIRTSYTRRITLLRTAKVVGIYDLNRNNTTWM